jgi:DNA-binding SARP family transcriptional activator
MTHFIKHTCLLFYMLCLPLFPEIYAAEAPAGARDKSGASGLSLNGNRFFRFNDRIALSFDLSLKKGYEQYLEYVVRISDLNRHNVDIILSLQSENRPEKLIISGDRLSKRMMEETKAVFLTRSVRFDLQFDLKGDRLSFLAGDTVFIETGLGLRPHTDYKILLGTGSAGRPDKNTPSALQIDNVQVYPDLLSSKGNAGRSVSTLYWIISIIFFDLLVFAFIVWKKRVQRKRLAGEQPEDSPGDEPAYRNETGDSSPDSPAGRSAVSLFGRFRVMDKWGDDISRKFTPLLKELFLILLFYSHRDGKGVDASFLKDLFWMDKDVQSANNNRAVNIGKLKAIMNDVGDYEISALRIDLGEDIACDYSDFQALLREKTFNRQQIIRLLDIAGKGPLLPECSYEWLDAFKAGVADAVIDTLSGFARMIDLSAEHRLAVRLSDTIFLFDPLNEEALSMKCRVLIHLGKHSAAKATYTRFSREYENLYGISYKYTFSEVSVS